jgi:hypothetical protein
VARATDYVPVGTDTTTVVTGESNGGDAPDEGDTLADQFDDGDGEVDLQEVLTMLDALNDPTDQRVTDIRTVLSALDTLNSDDPTWDTVEN